MNINLDNYEQYLLMYVDNELSAAERMQVDEFLRDYPYLQEELEILQQTVLPLETVLFDKSSLLKPMLDENTQEKLLMHLDGELPAGESLALQNSLKSNAMMQKEWALLQKTKLDAADIITHPDKESLYRREKARVISFVRWAVAAMLIGAGLFVAVKLVNNNKDRNAEIATNDASGKGKKETGVTGDKNNVETDLLTTNPDQLATTTDDKKEEKTTPVVKEETQPVKNNMLAVKDEKRVKGNEDIVAPKQKSNTAPDIAGNDQQPSNKTNVAQPKELPQRNTENVLKNNNEIAMVQPNNNNEIDLPTNINTSKRPVVDKLLTETTNSYARTASLGFDENNQDQILMMEEENVSRSKAAILLKKLKRNVERRANIKPGKSLRIAGFEFAVK